MEDKKQKFLEALMQGYGIIAVACEAVGISRSTYYRWYNSDPGFKEEVDEIAETQTDFVESKLMQLINANDTTAIIFYLKTKGKKRGYSDKAQKEFAPSAEPILPNPADEKEHRRIERRVKNKKDYIIKLLKSQSKYTAELTYQVELTAQLLVRAEVLNEEMLRDGYSSVNVEYSREGNERHTVNPKEKLYLNVASLAQRALRALGMNNDGKERRTEDDTLDEFMKAMKEGDE